MHAVLPHCEWISVCNCVNLQLCAFSCGLRAMNRTRIGGRLLVIRHRGRRRQSLHRVSLKVKCSLTMRVNRGFWDHVYGMSFILDGWKKKTLSCLQRWIFIFSYLSHGHKSLALNRFKHLLIRSDLNCHCWHTNWHSNYLQWTWTIPGASTSTDISTAFISCSLKFQLC